MKLTLAKFLEALIAVVFALAAGAVIIALTGKNVLETYEALFTGSLGSVRVLCQTVLSTTPLVFTALAFSVAYRGGLFNIGGEGQFYAGAIMGAWAAFAITGLPSWLHILVVILAGALGGAIIGALTGILKAKFSVNEVITGIMLTHIMIHVTNYLVSTVGPLRLGSTLPATPMAQESAKLPYLIPGYKLTGGFIVAIFVAFAIYVLLFKTVFGYKIRAVGHNPLAAENAGIKAIRNSIFVMILAGAIAGIGGSIEIIGVHRRFYASFSSGYGYEGIAVGMLSMNHPIGILASSFLFGALKTGATAMQIEAGTNAELIKVMQALIVFFIASKESFGFYFRKLMNRKISDQKEQKRQEQQT